MRPWAVNGMVALSDDDPLRSNGNSPLSHISHWFEMRVHGDRFMRPAVAGVKRERWWTDWESNPGR